jgi:acyl-CoA reductase-like NAD-dependent aldehyde dehydrogenase
MTQPLAAVDGFRIDAMPFGGMKQSGIGREGVRSAIEHMTEEKAHLLHRQMTSLPRAGS